MNFPTLNFTLHYQEYNADILTPVSVFLKLRDQCRDPLLLEATDFHALENCWSFVCLDPIAGIEISNFSTIEYKFPNQPVLSENISTEFDLNENLQSFLNSLHFNNKHATHSFAEGLYGYFSFEVIHFWEKTKLPTPSYTPTIPIVRFRFYKYVIAFNHIKNTLIIFESTLPNEESKLTDLYQKIVQTVIIEYPSQTINDEKSSISDDEYLNTVQTGIQHCYKGDVFQIVLSRRFQQSFFGDDFNIYRKLRRINPSPYLFYFDYGNYRLIGSSPEAQLIIKNGEATIHPIAGTLKRSGNDENDRLQAIKLLQDEKELAEHVMLVDLARNDLSVFCTDVEVTKYQQIQYFSHVIHIVSEVKGKIPTGTSSLDIFSKTFPAGTLSGAPKIKALELILQLEQQQRGFYSGSIGFLGCDGSINQAIMIRTALSKNNVLTSQAGAGIVAKSVPQKELEEVNNKLMALKKAMS
ncbi:MAG: anthranilate synthase component I family protein [Sediminibacterium sp.]|nr:anthranilate synthase component I family protein [Sediminibacterium sp.]